MRVCLVTGEYPPLQGGVGDYTARLGQALADQSAEVHVLTGTRAAGGHEPRNVTLHSVADRWDWRGLSQVLLVLRQIRPDLVHIQYQAAAYALHPAVNLLPWRIRWSAGWQVRGRRPRVVVTLHDLLYPYLFPKAGPLRFQSVLVMARGSDAVVVTNPEDLQRLARHRWLPPVKLIPIGSNIAAAPPDGYDRQVWRARLGVAPDEVLLCYFGFVSQAKGTETLIRALALLPTAGQANLSGYRLLMVGGQVGDSDPTNQAYLASMQTLIGELGLSGRVLWTGFAAPDQVSAHLLAADLAVLPYAEGANLRHGSLHACLAHGLPVVTTWSPFAAEHSALTDGENALLVPPGDAQALAAAVAALASDPTRRSRLAAGATALAREFTWQGIAARHLEMYERLAPGALQTPAP